MVNTHYLIFLVTNLVMVYIVRVQNVQNLLHLILAVALYQWEAEDTSKKLLISTAIF